MWIAWANPSVYNVVMDRLAVILSHNWERPTDEARADIDRLERQV